MDAPEEQEIKTGTIITLTITLAVITIIVISSTTSITIIIVIKQGVFTTATSIEQPVNVNME